MKITKEQAKQLKELNHSFLISWMEATQGEYAVAKVLKILNIDYKYEQGYLIVDSEDGVE